MEKLLLVVLLPAIGSVHLLGSPNDIPTNDHHITPLLLIAARHFNNQSNDAFLFKPCAVHRAQKQVVKGLRYLVNFDLSRTVCRKRDGNTDLKKCHLQSSAQMQQTFHCHIDVWTIPWMNKTQIQKFFCKA